MSTSTSTVSERLNIDESELLAPTLCKICSGPENDEMVFCENCSEWFDYKCVKFTQSDIDRIDNYYCNECEDSARHSDGSRLVTTWHGRAPADILEQSYKNIFYYTIETILDHHFEEGLERQFLVKWKNWGSNFNSWVTESGMDGAVDDLQKYLRRNNLPLSTVEPLYGAVDKSSDDQRNYVTMTQVLETFGKYRDQYPGGNILPFGQLDKFEDKDKLYFYPFEQHIFVILYLHKKRLGYIADGGNQFRVRGLAYEIKHYLDTKIRLRSVPYYQQKCIDHCGSSAVLIARELLRHYVIGRIPKRLDSLKRLSARLRVKMHTAASEQLAKVPTNVHFTKFQCRYCSKCYSTRRQNSVHELSCANKRK